MKRSKNRYISIIIICFVVFFIATIVIWTWKRDMDITHPIDYDAFDSFGSLYGGFVTSIILIITLRIAYKTYLNSEKNQIESRFFQLLSMVNETRKNLLKRDENFFAINIKIVRTFYDEIEGYRKEEKEKEKEWSPFDILKLAYLYFFYGIKEINKDLLKNITTINTDEVSKITEHFKNKGFNFKHPAFKSIGIYFRQLFQTVTYINDRAELNDEEKYQLIKTLRVTMNIEEQYLLFVNSLTTVGQEWEKNKNDKNKKLITKYNLIKNLPKHYSPIGEIVFSDKTHGYPDVHYEDSKSKYKEELEKIYD